MVLLFEVSVLVLRLEVLFRALLLFADFAPRFAPVRLRDAAFVPVFAFALLLFEPALRDFERAELALERFAVLREPALLAPRRVEAAFFLPPVARDFVLRLLPVRAALRDVVLRAVRPRSDFRLLPPSFIMPPPDDDPVCSLSSISSIPDPLLRAMANAS